MKEDNPIIDIADAATTNVEAPVADKAKPVDEKPVDEKADETPTADEARRNRHRTVRPRCAPSYANRR